MWGDWASWRRAIIQAGLVVLVGALLVTVLGPVVPPLVRRLARTPEPLLDGLAALGLEADRALVTGWAELELAPAPGGGPGPELGPTARRAMEALAGAELAAGAQVVSSEAGAEAPVVEYRLEVGEVRYRSRARLIQAGGLEVLYLVGSVEVRRPRQLAGLQERVEAALHTLGRTASRREPVYVTVFARLEGVLGPEDQRAAAARIAARLGGRRVHEHPGGSLYSLLLHSVLLGPSVQVAGRAVNLSVVLRPDPAAGATWVMLGTPLGAGEY